MNKNRKVYKSAFSTLHASNEMDWEAMKMEKRTTGVRCKRSLAVIMALVIMMVAMTCIGYAATGGKLFKEVSVFINGEEYQVTESKKAETSSSKDQLIELEIKKIEHKQDSD